ncbi:hypothetical protein [Hoeflea sp. TYP-13]|uniref:hypothetical protein n=1 Tax=Hoeflea sp. TYP-13 TaxID=3230023 RepID=UPI0034C5D152
MKKIKTKAGGKVLEIGKDIEAANAHKMVMRGEAEPSPAKSAKSTKTSDKG